MYFIVKKNNKDVKSLQDFFKPKKPKHLVILEEKDLSKIYESISELDVIQRLWLMRAMLGSSFRAMIRVNSGGIEIEGAGSYVDQLDEDKEDITG